MALPADSLTCLLNASASSRSFFRASAASSVDFLKARKAVTAAARTDRTKPSGLAFTAMLKSNIASLAERIEVVRDRKALTVPQMFINLCAAATAITAALYAPYVAMIVKRMLPTVSQFSIRVETRPREVFITPSCDWPMALNIVSIASSMFEICPVIVFDWASIRPPNLLPSLVRFSMAFWTSGNPTFPSSTSCLTWFSATPNCFASSSIRGIPRPKNWFRSCVYKRPWTIVVPYR